LHLINIENNTAVEEVMKIIGGWLNTDGSWLELYGKNNPNGEGIFLEEHDQLWDGTNDFKCIKVKFINTNRRNMIGTVESRELIHFEINLDGIEHYMKLHKFLTIRTFKKLIIKKFDIGESWPTIVVEMKD
jgi:hypothetical protein